MEVSECRYRGRVIGWLIEGPDGLLRYESQSMRACDAIIAELEKRT